MKDFGYNKDNKSSDKNQTQHPSDELDSKESKRIVSDDRYHVALALILWVASYLINKGFGFEAGTKENGVVITIGVLIWLVVTLHDYFKNRQ
ncbi:MAG: hypothetical protein KBT03_00115 [Bacteroidales bacterium]|nr:hypothetical protein [Candidatus Scybalousia scybalohippi]